MTEKKSSKLTMAIVAVLFAVLLGGLLLTQSKKAPAPEATSVAEQAAIDASGVTPAPVASIDVAAALSDRVLGNTSAPLKIVEHASLTCSHCGEFHKTTFDQVKANFIDTGKAYIVFSDFPLNEPAVKATMVARCLPQDKYFDFTHMLFLKQEEWAYDDNYLAWLKTAAGEQGLSPEQFDACVASTELEEGIKSRMQSVQDQWHITATPSFVLNNKTTLSGALPYDAFEKALNEELTRASPGAAEAAPAPAAEPASAAPPPTEGAETPPQE
jgi:protein-disulfide isomerase